MKFKIITAILILVLATLSGYAMGLYAGKRYIDNMFGPIFDHIEEKQVDTPTVSD